jgi:hypothetical protein
MCNLSLNTHPLDFENPHLASILILKIGNTFCFMLDLCHTAPTAFIIELFTDTVTQSANFSNKNKFPIFAII